MYRPTVFLLLVMIENGQVVEGCVFAFPDIALFVLYARSSQLTSVSKSILLQTLISGAFINLWNILCQLFTHRSRQTIKLHHSEGEE